MNKIRCNFCDRKGLLIYPVRYALACPAGAVAAPGLSGNFRIVGAPARIGTAKYTLRALRAGYLYSYDEKRKRLKAYIVMPTGFLRSFPTAYPAPNPAAARFACLDAGDIVLAHCVDIEHTEADPAGALWLGWSSVVWTKALLGKVDDATWRVKHMQKIDVGAMLAGSAAHSEEFSSGYKKIVHFALDKEAMHKAFDFGNTPVADEVMQHKWAAGMASFMAAQTPHNKGFIVAVNDPVGVTNDLSELTLPTIDSGFDEAMYRAKLISDILKATETNVRQQAKDDLDSDENINKLIDAGEDGNSYRDVKLGWQILKAGGKDKYDKQRAQEKLKYGQDLAGRQNAAADQAWEDITNDGGKPVLDQARLAAFPAAYDNAVKAYEPFHVKLAEAHLGWLTSPQLFNWMDGVHDGEDIRAGYAYSESMAQCIGKAVSGQMCIDQLSAWLNSDKHSDVDNLYVRALLFNQTAVVNAAESQIKAGDLQFESALNLYEDALARLERGEERRLFVRLALTTANVLIRALKQGSRSSMCAMATLHLRLLGGVAIKPGTATPDQLARWIMGQAQERGIALATNRQESKAAALTEANRIARSAAGNADVIYLELDLEKIAQDGRINPGAMKEVKIPGIETSRKWLGSSVPREFHLGVAATVIQLFAFGLAAQDLASNDRFNENETRLKAAIAAVSLAATVVDTVANLVDKAPTHPLAAFVQSQWASSARRAKMFIQGARYAGMFAGAAAAGYDIFVNALGAFRAHHRVAAGLYAVSGVVSACITYAAFFATSVFWPLFLTSIVLSIAIAIINIGELQKWISRCYFSINFSKNDILNSYKTLEEELTSFHNSIGG
jgi:hypothetical protein